MIAEMIARLSVKICAYVRRCACCYKGNETKSGIDMKATAITSPLSMERFYSQPNFNPGVESSNALHFLAFLSCC